MERHKTSEEVKSLKEQLAVTESKVDSLMTATVKIAQSTKTVSSKKQPKSFWEELFSALEEDQKKTEAQAKAKAARETVTVSSSYRLEDRYVVGKVELPEYLGSQPGTITVNITVDHVGSVKKTSVKAPRSLIPKSSNPSVRLPSRRISTRTSMRRKQLKGPLHTLSKRSNPHEEAPGKHPVI